MHIIIALAILLKLYLVLTFVAFPIYSATVASIKAWWGGREQRAIDRFNKKNGFNRVRT